MHLIFQNNFLSSIKRAFTQALPGYEEREAESIFYMLLEHYLGLSKSEFFQERKRLLKESEILYFEKAVIRLKTNEPVQYITGQVQFYDCTLKVNSSVLIPRPETEELVQIILNNHGQEEYSVLDIGTGSGCIPIALKKARPQWLMSAIDISTDAIEIAQTNADFNNVEVQFKAQDVLSLQSLPPNLDIIISNPPYVELTRKEKLEKRVSDFEPELALFVPDEDPLVFYKKIASFLKLYSEKPIHVYLELNEALASETLKVFQALEGKANILSDLAAKPRFLYFSKNR